MKEQREDGLAKAIAGSRVSRRWMLKCSGAVTAAVMALTGTTFGKRKAADASLAAKTEQAEPLSVREAVVDMWERF